MFAQGQCRQSNSLATVGTRIVWMMQRQRQMLGLVMSLLHARRSCSRSESVDLTSSPRGASGCWQGSPSLSCCSCLRCHSDGALLPVHQMPLAFVFTNVLQMASNTSGCVQQINHNTTLSSPIPSSSPRTLRLIRGTHTHTHSLWQSMHLHFYSDVCVARVLASDCCCCCCCCC